MGLNWVKWRVGFSRSSEVLRIARSTNLDPRLAACCLMEFLEWFDAQARSFELRIYSMTPAHIDEMLRIPDGFTAAIIKTGYFKIRHKKLVAINREWAGSGQGKRHADSFVYFIESIRTGLIKIGFSNDPQRRVSELTTSEPVRLLGQVVGTVASEKKLHKQFAATRVHGEWFSKSDELLAMLRSKGFIA